jgi:hypothetical protein
MGLHDVFDWDGTNLPDEIRQLPPGRYLVYPFEGIDELTEEEDAGIQLALDQIEAGEDIPAAEVTREIRSRARRDTM